MQEIKPSDELIKEIWAKAKPIIGEDPSLIREDEKGFWMVFHQFRTNDKCAWDIIERIQKGTKSDERRAELIPIATLPYRVPFGRVDVVCGLFDITGSLDH